MDFSVAADAVKCSKLQCSTLHSVNYGKWLVLQLHADHSVASGAAEWKVEGGLRRASLLHHCTLHWLHWLHWSACNVCTIHYNACTLHAHRCIIAHCTLHNELHLLHRVYGGWLSNTVSAKYTAQCTVKKALVVIKTLGAKVTAKRALVVFKTLDAKFTAKHALVVFETLGSKFTAKRVLVVFKTLCAKFTAKRALVVFKSLGAKYTRPHWILDAKFTSKHALVVFETLGSKFTANRVLVVFETLCAKFTAKHALVVFKTLGAKYTRPQAAAWKSMLRRWLHNDLPVKANLLLFHIIFVIAKLKECKMKYKFKRKFQ